MTTLVDPTQAFLAQDPTVLHEPEQPVEPATPVHSREHVARELAAAALVSWLLARRYLAGREAKVGHTREQAREAWTKVLPVWLRLSVPAIRHAYALGHVEGLTEDELAVLAADYARQLGDYLDSTSADALADGMNAQLSQHWSEPLAWHRAVSAYGLDRREMRTYIAGLMQAKITDDPIPKASRLLVDRALLARASRIGDTESVSATQAGQGLAWLWLYRTGRLPPGTTKGWELGEDEQHCGVCTELAKQRVAPDEPFRLPSGAPIWSPRAHPGCPCRLRLITPGELTKADVTVAGLCVQARDTGRVLMIQRANDPKDPAGGTWEFPGGHLDPGETPWQAAVREWQEEVHRRFPGPEATASWTSGIYQGFVCEVLSESSVPSHSRGRVINPDDPDGDEIEAIAWWDVAHLARNPAVRPELRASLSDLRAALGQVTKAYDPREPRDRRGRWADVAEAEQDAPVTERNPFAAQPSPFSTASPFGNPFGSGPFGASPFAATKPAANPFAAAKPKAQRSRLVRTVVLVPPAPPPKPSHDEHYLSGADLFSALGWGTERLGIGDAIDFDDAQTKADDDLLALRMPDAWHAERTDPSGRVEEEQLDDHLWSNVLMAGRHALTVANDDPERYVGKVEVDDGQPVVRGGKLSYEDLIRIASTAGYSGLESYPDLANRIVRAVNGESDDESLAAAYGDYMVFVKHGLLGEAGEDVDRRLTDALGDHADLEQMFTEPPQVLAFADTHRDTAIDRASGTLRPEQDYYVAGLTYHSRLADAPAQIAPQVIGMQELLLKPLHDEPHHPAPDWDAPG